MERKMVEASQRQEMAARVQGMHGEKSGKKSPGYEKYGFFTGICGRKKEKEKLGEGASWGKSDYFGKYLEKLQ